MVTLCETFRMLYSFSFFLSFLFSVIRGNVYQRFQFVLKYYRILIYYLCIFKRVEKYNTFYYNDIMWIFYSQYSYFSQDNIICQNQRLYEIQCRKSLQFLYVLILETNIDWLCFKAFHMQIQLHISYLCSHSVTLYLGSNITLLYK